MILTSMRLFVVRHGQTAWNLEGRAQGHTDIPLDTFGLEQARCLAGRFDPGCRIGIVFSSDLLRARQTAEPLAVGLGATLQLRPDLRERSFGDLEGCSFKDLWRRMDFESADQQSDTLRTRPPGGESTSDVWVRLDPFMAEIQSLDESAVIVTHGGTGALILSKLIRGTLETSRSFAFGNTAFTELERRPDGYYRILRYNDTSHVGRSAVLSGSLEGTAR